jgi:hypothetical protein
VSVEWTGDRVETRALMPVTSFLSSMENAFPPPPRTAEPFVTAGDLWGALLAVGALTAGAAVVTPLVALLFFRI